MSSESRSKIQARHLGRNAYLYVRQSTLHQVFENTESTRRQYQLRRRAIALGWPADHVIVIDSDQGQSGATSADREGFQHLMTEVSMGRAGIVMGLEVSRLARNSADWHRLLEICALTDTLILDEDGVYDPAHYNDRLLLGLKGTMSEAELHVLRARLRGGILSQARRGALKVPLPIGFIYDEDGQVRLNPDQRVQDTIRLLFRSFRRVGSAVGVVRFFREQDLAFPRHPFPGKRTNKVIWGELTHGRVLFLLKNPRYAGAFFFGSTRQRKRPDGGVMFDRLPRDEWFALIPDAHEGYITWEEFEENRRRLEENAAARGLDRRRGPPREGPALLQGLVVCAKCGTRMSVSYHVRGERRIPDYTCARHGIQRSEPPCQIIHGEALDEAIGQLLVETVSPVTLEVALAVQQELESRAAEADQLRRKAVESARYDAELARRRYMRVDPDNRLVADALEAEWNGKLRAVAEAEERYEQQSKAARSMLDDEQRRRITALASDFPRLWNDPRTPDRERKRMARLLIEDVTLLKRNEVTAHVRFKGGATHSLKLPLPKRSWELHQTPKEVIDEIDRLLDEHIYGEIAQVLNERGIVSGTGVCFTGKMIRRIRQDYDLKTPHSRLREKGMLNKDEMAAKLGIRPDTLNAWRRKGFVVAFAYNDKGQYLYPPPGDDAPLKGKHNKRQISHGLQRICHADDGGCAV